MGAAVEAWQAGTAIGKAMAEKKAEQLAALAAHEHAIMMQGFRLGFATCLGIVSVVLIVLGIVRIVRRSKVA